MGRRKTLETEGLPASIEAEQWVLGSILINEAVYQDVASRIRTQDFSIEKHRLLWKSMEELQALGEPIDDLTLYQRLIDSDRVKAVGGAGYLTQLTKGLPQTRNIKSYVEILKRKSALRDILTISENAKAQVYENGKPPAEIARLVQERLFAIEAEAAPAARTKVSDLISDYPGGREALADQRRMPQGIPTPFTKFDELTGGLHAGELIIIAARPGMGKTAFATRIAQAIALDRDVELFSLEMPASLILQRLICAKAWVDLQRYKRGYLDEEERRRIEQAIGSVEQLRLSINDKSSIDIFEIYSKCRQAKQRGDLGLVVVDYLQLISGTSSSGRRSRVEQVTEISRGLKLMAGELKIPVIALSQLSRAPETRSGSNRPILSDLRDSGSIEQDGDVVAFIYRGDYYKPDREDLRGKAELIIAKQRNGPIGTVKLSFIKQYATFENLAEDIQGELEEGEPPF